MKRRREEENNKKTKLEEESNKRDIPTINNTNDLADAFFEYEDKYDKLAQVIRQIRTGAIAKVS